MVIALTRTLNINIMVPHPLIAMPLAIVAQSPLYRTAALNVPLAHLQILDGMDMFGLLAHSAQPCRD